MIAAASIKCNVVFHIFSIFFEMAMALSGFNHACFGLISILYFCYDDKTILPR